MNNVVLVNFAFVGVEKIDCRVLGEAVCDVFEGVVRKKVIGVEQPDVLTRRHLQRDIRCG